MTQAYHSPLRRRRLVSDAELVAATAAAGVPFFFAATKIRIGRGTRGRNSRCRRNHSPVCLRRHPSGDTGSLAESLHRKKRAPHLRERLSAVRTRLELATPGVTGRYSNRLNYRTSPASLLEGIAKIVTFFNSTRVASDFFISL